jgi:tetratricopeptide (TPR) repeat protein
MELALARTNYPEAIKAAVLATQLAPNSADVVRGLARLLTTAQASDALSYWQRLVAMGAATAQDRRQYVQLALDLDRLNVAGAELKALGAEEPKNLENLLLSVRLYRELHRFPDAIKAAQAAVSVSPADTRARFTLGELLWERGQAGPGTPGRRLIWDFTAETNTYRHAALDLLLTDEKLTKTECQTLLQRFASVPEVSLADGLRIAELHLRLNPEKLTAIADELTAKVGAGTNALDIAFLSGWLGRHRLYTNVILLSGRPEVADHRMVLPNRLDALASLGRFEEFDRLFSANKTNLTPVTAYCLNGLRLTRENRLVDAEIEFRAALNVGANQPDPLAYLSLIAERCGLTNVSIDAQKRLLNQPGHGLTAARSLMRLVAPLDDLPTVKQVMDFMVTALPDAQFVALEHAYLHLLLNDQVALAQKELETIHAQKPEDAEVRIVLAFALAKSGKADAALTLIESSAFDWSKAQPRWQALYVSVLGSAGQREAARQNARMVDMAKLKLAERDLVQPWR